MYAWYDIWVIGSNFEHHVRTVFGRYTAIMIAASLVPMFKHEILEVRLAEFRQN